MTLNHLLSSPLFHVFPVRPRIVFSHDICGADERTLPEELLHDLNFIGFVSLFKLLQGGTILGQIFDDKEPLRCSDGSAFIGCCLEGQSGDRRIAPVTVPVPSICPSLKEGSSTHKIRPAHFFICAISREVIENWIRPLEKNGSNPTRKVSTSIFSPAAWCMLSIID